MSKILECFILSNGDFRKEFEFSTVEDGKNIVVLRIVLPAELYGKKHRLAIETNGRSRMTPVLNEVVEGVERVLLFTLQTSMFDVNGGYFLQYVNEDFYGVQRLYLMIKDLVEIPRIDTPYWVPIDSVDENNTYIVRYQSGVQSVYYILEQGAFVFIKDSGEQVKVDLNLEKIVADFYYEEEEYALTLLFADDTTMKVELIDFLPKTVLEWDSVLSAGRLYGGEFVVDNIDSTVTVSAGGGLVKEEEASSSEKPAIQFEGQASHLVLVNWPETELELVPDVENIVYYDGEENQLQVTSNSEEISFTRDFVLGKVFVIRSGEGDVDKDVSTSKPTLVEPLDFAELDLSGEDLSTVTITVDGVVVVTSGVAEAGYVYELDSGGSYYHLTETTKDAGFMIASDGVTLRIVDADGLFGAGPFVVKIEGVAVYETPDYDLKLAEDIVALDLTDVKLDEATIHVNDILIVENGVPIEGFTYVEALGVYTLLETTIGGSFEIAETGLEVVTIEPTSEFGAGPFVVRVQAPAESPYTYELLVNDTANDLFNFNRRLQDFGNEIMPIKRASGLMLTMSGLKVELSEGILYGSMLNRFTIPAFNSGEADNFVYWYEDGDGGFTKLVEQTDIDALHYDDGTGTVAELTIGKYGAHWVYVTLQGTVHIVYGKGDYTLEESEGAIPPINIPDFLKKQGFFVGRVIVLKSGSEVTSCLSPFEVGQSYEITFEEHAVLTDILMNGIDGGQFDEGGE